MRSCEQSTIWITNRNLFNTSSYDHYGCLQKNTEENNQKWEKNYKKHGENYVTSWL